MVLIVGIVPDAVEPNTQPVAPLMLDVLTARAVFVEVYGVIAAHHVAHSIVTLAFLTKNTLLVPNAAGVMILLNDKSSNETEGH